jgi:hypothetical protein
MIYVLAVFRSRTQTMTFFNILKSYRINCFVVNTPRQIMTACGISVKFDTKSLDFAKNILFRRKFDSFVGFYKVTTINHSLITTPIF